MAEAAEANLEKTLSKTKRASQHEPDSPPGEQDDEAQLPPLEKSATTKTITGLRANSFIFFIVLTQLIQMIPYGAGINTAFIIGPQLGVPKEHGAWIASSYPLTQGSFVLIGGTLGAVYGHKRMLSLGSFWWVFWTLATGLGDNLVAVAFMRGLSGMGGGLMVPNAVALLGITFPPGQKRNMGLALFGAMAPVGAAGGSLVAGAFVQEVQWKWLFLFLALCGAVVYGAAILLVPDDEPQLPDMTIDWVGAYLGVAGLILFNFSWNQAPFTGWDEPYVYVLLIVSILHFVAFLVWEAKFATNPILPLSIWTAPSFGPLMLALFLVFMSIGIYIWYCTVTLYSLRNFTPVLVGVSYLPLTILGACAAFLAGWLAPRLKPQVIIAIGCLSAITSNVLLATSPAHQIYWAQIFPSMIVIAFSADLVFAASQIIASNAVARKYQGAAGSLIGTLLSYGLSTGLGFAGTVEAYTNKGGRDVLQGIRGAEYLAIGFAGAALAVDVLFVRMPRSDQEGWNEEDKEQKV
jgi:MFS family permease